MPINGHFGASGQVDVPADSGEAAEVLGHDVDLHVPSIRRTFVDEYRYQFGL